MYNVYLISIYYIYLPYFILLYIYALYESTPDYIPIHHVMHIEYGNKALLLFNYMCVFISRGCTSSHDVRALCYSPSRQSEVIRSLRCRSSSAESYTPWLSSTAVRPRVTTMSPKRMSLQQPTSEWRHLWGRLLCRAAI